jgi:hypothetical protein
MAGSGTGKRKRSPVTMFARDDLSRHGLVRNSRALHQNQSLENIALFRCVNEVHN